jgi:hypothetical protein
MSLSEPKPKETETMKMKDEMREEMFIRMSTIFNEKEDYPQHSNGWYYRKFDKIIALLDSINYEKRYGYRDRNTVRRPKSIKFECRKPANQVCWGSACTRLCAHYVEL